MAWRRGWSCLHGEPGAAVEAFVVLAGQLCGLLVGARQQGEELVEAFEVALEVGRQLPEDGPQFVAKTEHALGEEIGQRNFRIEEPAHVGYEARSLDREDEAGRGFVVPAVEVSGPLEGVEGAVQLDGVERGGRRTQVRGAEQARAGKSCRASLCSASRRCRFECRPRDPSRCLDAPERRFESEGRPARMGRVCLSKFDIRGVNTSNRPFRKAASQGIERKQSTFETRRKRMLAVVTGASSGIGYELAAELAKRGYDLVVASAGERLTRAAEKFRTFGTSRNGSQRRPGHAGGRRGAVAAGGGAGRTGGRGLHQCGRRAGRPVSWRPIWRKN